MLIQRLALTNFGPIKETVELTPTNGITLISGVNGTGKSTIVKALALLLFNKADKKIEDYINWDSDTPNSFNLEIEFTHDNETFKIEYDYEKKGKQGTANRKLVIGEDNIYFNSDAVKILEQYFDSELSYSAFISRQKERDLVSLKPAERRENLKKIYDLDFIDELEKIDAEVKNFDTLIQEKEKEIYAYENRNYKYLPIEELPFSESEYSLYKEKIEKLVLLIEKLKTEKNTRKELVEEIENIQTDISRQNKKLKDLYSKIETYKNRIEKADSQDEINDIDLSIKDIEKELEDQEQIYSLAFEYKKKADSIILFRIKKFDDKELLQNKEAISEKLRQLKNIQDRINAIKNGKCYVCGAEYDSSEIEKVEDEKKAVQTEIDSLREIILTQEKENKEYLEKKEELQKIKEEKNKYILKYEYELEKADTLVTRKKEEVVKLIQTKKDTIKRNKERINEYTENIEECTLTIKEGNKDIQSLEDTLAVKKKKLSEMPERPDIVKFKNDLEYYTKELKTYDAIQANNVQAIKFNKQVEENKEKDQKEKEKEEKEKAGLQDTQKNYIEAKNILRKDFPSFVISRMVESIERGMNKFIDTVYYKSLDVKIQETKNAINITYGKNDQDVIHLSGAEESITSLAYRNHLNQLMGLGTIVLDEVDAHLTEENALKFYDVLGHMKNDYKQVFIISHNERAKEKLLSQYSAKYYEIEDGRIMHNE